MSYSTALATRAAAGGGSTSSANGVLGNNIYFYTDVLLLCIAALLFLAALPRAVARLTKLSAWTQGWFLYSARTGSRSRRVGSLSPKSSDIQDYSESSFARRVVSQRRVNLERGQSVGLTSLRGNDNTSEYDSSLDDGADRYGGPPIHMPAWSSFFPGISARLSATLRPAYSVGRVLILLAYTTLMLFIGLEGGNPFVQYVPAGWVATSQIPVVFILGTKNNVLGMLVGQGYEKFNYLHRFAGRFVFLAANVHSLGYLYKWSIEGSLSENLHPNIVWGFVALVCADFLFFLSLRTLRDTLYPLFYASHVLCAIILLPAVALHETTNIPYVVVAVALYALDRVLRICQTRIVHAHLRTIPELGTVMLKVPHLDAGWRAGQHVRIRVFSTVMGWWGWAEGHPFTIASAAENPDGDGLVLLCKTTGGWGERLGKMARLAEYHEAGGGLPRVRVLVDGPYGGPGHAVIASYSAAMLVAGGSGVSYPLAVAEELLRDAARGASHVQIIALVWSVPDASSLKPLIPLFTRLLRASRQSGTQLRISLFYTQATSSSGSSKSPPSIQSVPHGLTIHAGRPPLSSVLSNIVDRTLEVYKASDAWTPRGEEGGHARPSGVFVGACGPRTLGEDTERVVRAFGARDGRARDVGGVECQLEVFGW